jgi:hypothetical protein
MYCEFLKMKENEFKEGKNLNISCCVKSEKSLVDIVKDNFVRMRKTRCSCKEHSVKLLVLDELMEQVVTTIIFYV